VFIVLIKFKNPHVQHVVFADLFALNYIWNRGGEARNSTKSRYLWWWI